MNKIYIILFLSFICVNICGASTDSRKAFIKKYKSIAIEEMDRTGIPASIKLAKECWNPDVELQNWLLMPTTTSVLNATTGTEPVLPWTMINETNVFGNTEIRKNHG